MDYYFNQLMEIQNSTDHSFFLLDQDSEPRFVIEADKRTIIIPAEFQFLGVKTDQRSEKIYFEVDRIFDDVDLSTKTCVIQYINAGTDDVDEGIYPVTELDTTTVPGKIVFKWEVDNIVCKYAGVVAFSVRFYEIDPETKLYTYCWNTIPESLPVLDGLNVSGSVTEDFPTELLEWNARMAALNTEITNKISAADATMKADLKTAKGYMDGAQAARGGAEEAESRVKKIVAGNEAYTKAESDNVYAKSQVKESERGTSVEVYPEDGSNLAVTAYGFTEQAGSGDSSPNNLRAITNCGVDNYFVPEMLAPEVTWDAETKTLTKPSSTGIYYDIFNGTTGLNTVATNYIQLLPNTKYVFSAGACDTATEVFVVANDGTVSKITGNLANASIEAETGETGRITIRMYATGKSKAANLSIKKYNTEEIFDYVVSKSGINGVTFLPLTAPLCEGDSVVSWARSGCDQQLTLDGSQLPTSVATLNTVYRITFTLATPAVSGPQYSESFFEKTDFSLNAEHFYASTNLYVFVDKAKLAGDTKENAQQYFAAHPLTVWYRSTNYTPAADIPVSLETHQRAVLVLDGTENWIWNKSANGIYRGVLKNVSPQGKNGFPMCSHAKSQTTFTNTNGVTAEGGTFTLAFPDVQTESGLTDFKAYLAAQYAAGTPVTIVYELAAPLVYAHPAVDIISNISDNDSVLISGQKEISVSYHKSLDKTIVELDNKSYSKQDSHNIFARALRGTAEAAKSITIHPDAGSNVIVTAHGFTKQAGSGDPSPSNVRALTNGGLRYTRVVLDGTERVERVKRLSTVGGYYYQLRASKISTPVTNFNPPKNTTVCNKFALGNAHSTPGNVVVSGNIAGDNIIRIGFADDPGSVSAVQSLFQAAYESGDPYIVWVPQATEGSLYAPIILEGGEYRATCLPLTAPLCEGDSVVSWVKSGCDMQVTLDGGTSDGFVYTDRGASGNMRRIQITIPGVFDYRRGRFGFSDWVKYHAYFNATEESFYCGDKDTVYLFLAAESLAAAKQILSQKPLTMWLRSTNYTPAADIPVSLETHQRAVLVLDGTEKSHIYDRFFYLDGMSGLKPQSTTSGICSHYQYTTYGSRKIGVALDGRSIVYSPDGDYVIDEEGLTKWKADLAAQYAAGTPVTIVYQLATHITYAHPAVELPALPDDTGKVTITGEADGTVSAEYNKDITYAFNELQSAVLSAIANLSL